MSEDLLPNSTSLYSSSIASLLIAAAAHSVPSIASLCLINTASSAPSASACLITALSASVPMHTAVIVVARPARFKHTAACKLASSDGSTMRLIPAVCIRPELTLGVASGSSTVLVVTNTFTL
ncbi:MAG: hypothetical protein AAI978_00935 [Candidatus Hodgkinia cicadicola]